MALNNPILRSVGGGGDGPKLPIRNIVMWLVIIVIAVAVVTIAGCGIKVVDTGQRGIQTRFGKIASESLPEGLYFYNPVH